MKKLVVALITLLALTLSVAMADTLILPDDLTTIGTEAFYGTDADTIILPTGVTTIGDQAFGGSTSLRTVYVPNNLMDREQAALGDSYPTARFVSFESLAEQFRYSIKTDSVWISGYTGTQTAVVIPSSIQGKPVTVIDTGAFRDNQTITGVVIPAGVTEIKDNVFNGCTALTDVSLPSSLTKIGNYVFSSCTGLTEIRLPDQLTKIGTEDFLGCTGLKAIGDLHFADSSFRDNQNAGTNLRFYTAEMRKFDNRQQPPRQKRHCRGRQGIREISKWKQIKHKYVNIRHLLLINKLTT